LIKYNRDDTSRLEDYDHDVRFIKDAKVYNTTSSNHKKIDQNKLFVEVLVNRTESANEFNLPVDLRQLERMLMEHAVENDYENVYKNILP